MSKKLKISKEELEKIVKYSRNIVHLTENVREKFGKGSYKGIYFLLKKHNIDTSSFETAKDRIQRNKHKLNKSKTLEELKEEYLIENSTIARSSIKSYIIKYNLIEYRCCNCKSNDQWMGKTMPLILDHINGINNDNRLENLRFLCPNCNSIQDTFCGKNINGQNKIKNKNNSNKTTERKIIFKQPRKEIYCIQCHSLTKHKKFCNKECSILYYNSIGRKKQKSFLSKEAWVSKLNNQKQKHIEKMKDNIHLVDFNRTGWRLIVSKILNTTPQHAGGFIQKNFPEIWEKAWKHSR